MFGVKLVLVVLLFGTFHNLGIFVNKIAPSSSKCVFLTNTSFSFIKRKNFITGNKTSVNVHFNI